MNTHHKPSEKQLKFTRDLADKHGIDLPENVKTSKIECSSFITMYINERTKNSSDNDKTDLDCHTIQNAYFLSKEGKHKDAAQIYANIHAKGKLDPGGRKQYGWEIYRLIKVELEEKQNNKFSLSTVQRVKKYLNTYLKLDIGGPDLLHSLMLRQASRLTKEHHIKMLPFLRLWNPEQFTDEDFTRQTGKDGKTYSSLVEKVIQVAASQATESDLSEDHDFILPHVELAMTRFPDNIWLKHKFVKLLRSMGRIDDALKMAIEFAREKSSEYWSWEMIGDLVLNDNDLKRSCYAKALICSQDDNFVGKVRLKFAALLEKSHPAHARFEVDKVMISRADAGYKVLPDAQNLVVKLNDLTPKPTNYTFYRQFSNAAEVLLFSHLPWTNACLGDIFTIPERDGKKHQKRCRIYVNGDPFAIEMSLPSNHQDIRGLTKGTPLKIQYETLKNKPGHTKIHRVCNREEGTYMDIVPSRIGVIDNINHKKIHVIVDRGVDGDCSISLYDGQAKIGDTVMVRLARYHSKSGEYTRIVEIKSTDQTPSLDVCRPFRDNVTKVIPDGPGFTHGHIFIPSQVITTEGIQKGDLIEGKAIINFDKKRKKWGMKAINVCLSH